MNTFIISPKTGKPYKVQTKKQKWWSSRNWNKFLVSGIITSLTNLILIRNETLTIFEVEKIVSARNLLDQVIWHWEEENKILRDVHNV